METTNTTYDVPAEDESERKILCDLNELEMQLASRLGLTRRVLRKELQMRLRAGTLAEDELVSRWLEAHHVAMEYAAERAAGPPHGPTSRNEEQGPHDAALAVFGVDSGRQWGGCRAMSCCS